MQSSWCLQSSTWHEPQQISPIVFFGFFLGSFILFHSVCLFCLFIQLISITSVSSIILGMIRDDDSSRMIP